MIICVVQWLNIGRVTASLLSLTIYHSNEEAAVHFNFVFIVCRVIAGHRDKMVLRELYESVQPSTGKKTLIGFLSSKHLLQLVWLEEGSADCKVKSPLRRSGDASINCHPPYFRLFSCAAPLLVAILYGDSLGQPTWACRLTTSKALTAARY